MENKKAITPGHKVPPSVPPPSGRARGPTRHLRIRRYVIRAAAPWADAQQGLVYVAEPNCIGVTGCEVPHRHVDVYSVPVHTNLCLSGDRTCGACYRDRRTRRRPGWT